MVDPVEDYLDRLLAPRAIDSSQVALILQPLMTDRTLQEFKALVAAMAARDGYNCNSQTPPILEHYVQA